jgi:hypothetical protein
MAAKAVEQVAEAGIEFLVEGQTTAPESGVTDAPPTTPILVTDPSVATTPQVTGPEPGLARSTTISNPWIERVYEAQRSTK